MKRLAMPMAIAMLVALVGVLAYLNSRRSSAIEQWQSNAATQRSRIDAANGEIATLQEQGQELVVTQSALATRLALKTEQVLQTVIVPVTVTPTQTPEFTATITPVPSQTPVPSSTPRPTATQDPTRRSRSDGFYLVGSEISPGLWRSTGTGDSCYWETTSRTGDINNNHFGMAGGTMYVRPSDFQVRLEGCGTWQFLSP